jgi:peroxiredoxin
MIELGELESHYQDFEKRSARVVVVSVEDQSKAKETQGELPHLVVVADSGKKLANALDLIHSNSGPEGGDTAAPTTILLDGNGTVRWLYRPPSAFRRLSPAELLTAVDEHLTEGKK